MRFDTDGVLTPGEGTFTEKIIPGPAASMARSTSTTPNCTSDKAFPEQAETVYWLKIVALDVIPSLTIPVEQRLQWGWHNRDYTIKDPFASTPAAGVSPGEHEDGFLPLPLGPQSRFTISRTTP